MIINVNKIKDDIVQLNKLIDTYEDNYYNMYNEMKNCSSLWINKKAFMFFDSVDVKKKSIENYMYELGELRDLYSYLINKYEYIGNKIEADIDQVDTIALEFDNFLEDIYAIMEKFNEIKDVNINLDEVYSCIDELIEITGLLVNLKYSIKHHLLLCNEIEKFINLKISKVNIDFIKVDDMSIFLGDNNE